MRALGLSLLMMSVGMVGCGPDLQSACEEQVQCKGGNDKDIEACVAVGEVAEDLLDELECGDEYDAYFDCTQAYMKCTSSPTGRPCMAASDCDANQACTNGECVAPLYSLDDDGRDKCKVEIAAYNSCVQF